MKKLFDLFGSKGMRDKFAETPEKRVNLFIAHWFQKWSSARSKMGDDVDFDIWASLVSEVDDAHFVEGSGSGTSNSFGSKADFDPSDESITECDISGDSAFVYSEKYDQALKSSTYHVYELQCNGEKNWLIREVLTLFGQPKGTVIESGKQNQILAMTRPDSPLVKGQDNLNLNENTLFQGNRNVELPHLGEGLVTVSTVGKINLSSGIIGIMDFGYEIYEFEPLHRKVNPGAYPVETVSIHNRIAGIRIRFSDQERPVKWYAANTPSGNGVYGVDAGNLAVFDVENLCGLSRIQKERLFSQWSLHCRPQLLSMTKENDCFIASSGFGDGTYPAFWGVSSDDKVVSLHLDFMILVRQNEEGIYETV